MSCGVTLSSRTRVTISGGARPTKGLVVKPTSDPWSAPMLSKSSLSRIMLCAGLLFACQANAQQQPSQPEGAGRKPKVKKVTVTAPASEAPKLSEEQKLAYS